MTWPEIEPTSAVTSPAPGAATGTVAPSAPGHGARRVRVAQIITGLVLGGGGQVMRGLARNIDTTRFDVDFYCVIEGGPVRQELEDLGFRVVICPAYDHRRLMPYSVGAVLRLARALRRRRYDIVHTHLFQADVVGRLAARIAGTPHIVKTLHNMGRWKSPSQLALDRLLNRWTDRVVCISDHQRRVVVRQERLAAQKVRTIPNGVDKSRFRANVNRAERLRELGLAPERVTIGTVGRFIEEKGQVHLIRALPGILDRCAGAQFLLVGDGRLRSRFEALINAEPWSRRVSLPGLRYDVPELLSLMDVFVFPSLSEGFGIAPFEAMAAGVPVACSSIPPLGELLTHRETAFLFSPADANAIVDAVNAILGDGGLRERLIEGGRELVERRFSEAGSVRAIEDLYIELLRTGAPRR